MEQNENKPENPVSNSSAEETHKTTLSARPRKYQAQQPDKELEDVVRKTAVEEQAKTLVSVVERLGVPTLGLVAAAVLLYLAGAWLGPNVIKPLVDSSIKLPDILAKVADTNQILATSDSKRAENEAKRQEWAAMHEQKFITLLQLNVEKLDALKEEVRSVNKKLPPTPNP